MITNVSVNSADVADVYRRRIYGDSTSRLSSGWLGQANYIFDCLDIASNLQNYGSQCKRMSMAFPRTSSLPMKILPHQIMKIRVNFTIKTAGTQTDSMCVF